ncbi:MAG: tail fiber domain-containing protein [Polaromonas sp.]|nr:tail fiber domain-containing protein [Polaromonas sp.]
MNDKSVIQVVASPEAADKKKTYQPPSLRTFGQVHMLTQSASMGVNGDGGQGMMVANSDRSIKENIVQVGTHPSGIGLYLFDYKPDFWACSGNGRQFGVMADEVEVVMPEAVLIHPDGYKQVNYAMLGMDLSKRRVH